MERKPKYTGKFEMRANKEVKLSYNIYDLNSNVILVVKSLVVLLTTLFMFSRKARLKSKKVPRSLIEVTDDNKILFSL